MGWCRHYAHLYVPGHVLVCLCIPERCGHDVNWGPGEESGLLGSQVIVVTSACVSAFVG